MKRWGLLAAAALLSVGTALAEEEPSRHIRTTISGEAYAVAVDAGVYGEEQKAVQAYRVTTLDLGKNPEAHFDLALWFGTDALLENTGGDYTIFYPKGEDAEIGARDEAGFSPYGLYFERATNARLEFPLERWNQGRIQEKTNTAEIPEGLSLEGAAESILPVATALGVEMARQPVFVSVMTQADWQAETARRLERGVAPHERVVEDWTAEDESIQLNYRQFFHGLPMLETDAHMPGILEWETPLTMVSATVSRRGVERLDFRFVVGGETLLGEAFAPISPEEALAACNEAELGLDGWQNLHVSAVELGYAMLAQNRAKTECIARPAWLIRIWGEIFGETESVAVAVDAQTGKILTQ